MSPGWHNTTGGLSRFEASIEFAKAWKIQKIYSHSRNFYFDYFKHQTRRKFSQRLVSPINKTWLIIIAHSLTQRNKVGNLLGAESR